MARKLRARRVQFARLDPAGRIGRRAAPPPESAATVKTRTLAELPDLCAELRHSSTRRRLLHTPSSCAARATARRILLAPSAVPVWQQYFD
jgi:hypothetical protein